MNKSLAGICAVITAAGFAFPPLFRQQSAAAQRPAPYVQTQHANYEETIEQPDPAVLDMQRRGAAAAAKRNRIVTRYSAADGDDPELSLPEVISGAVGQFIIVQSTTNCAAVKFVPLDVGLSVFPSRMLTTPTETVVVASAAGNYRLLAYAALGGVATDPVITMVQVGTAPQPPPIPPPGPAPNPPGPTPPIPPPAPPAQTAALTIISIDNAQARNVATQQFISAGAYWANVKAAGHSFWLMDSNNTAQTAKYAAQISSIGGVPGVVIMDSATSKVLGVAAYPKDATGKPNPSTGWITSLIAKYGGLPIKGQ